VGTSLLVITLVSLSAVAGVFVAGDPFPAESVAPFLVGSLAGMALGTAAARRIGGPVLQKSFAVAILGVAVWVIAKNVLSV
jgi:uncharacterized membrane protein YfcA